MSPTPFVVSRFVNRNGITSWRVDGRIHGLRFRKNFKTREKARAERAALEAKAAQAAAGVRLASTFLSEDQLRDCESAIRRLADKPKPRGQRLDPGAGFLGKARMVAKGQGDGGDMHARCLFYIP